MSLFLGLPVRQNSEHWRSHKEGMDLDIPSNFQHPGKTRNSEAFQACKLLLRTYNSNHLTASVLIPLAYTKMSVLCA